MTTPENTTENTPWDIAMETFIKCSTNEWGREDYERSVAKFNNRLLEMCEKNYTKGYKDGSRFFYGLTSADEKYVKELAGKNNMKNTKPTEEYLKYLHEALEYAIKRGFKVKIFNKDGEIVALQG